jgi:hypothetical protein
VSCVVAVGALLVFAPAQARSNRPSKPSKSATESRRAKQQTARKQAAKQRGASVSSAPLTTIAIATTVPPEEQIQPPVSPQTSPSLGAADAAASQPASQPTPTDGATAIAPSPVLNDNFDPTGYTSRPSSKKTIYLDFDGATIAGTAWNAEKWGGEPRTVSAFDIDGNPSSMSAESGLIHTIWTAVAEDFAPFHVNVTTQKPTDDQINRTNASDQVYGMTVIITPDNPICPGTCRSASHFASFGSVNSPGTLPLGPTFVFMGPALGAISNAIPHELGHTFGLQHHGTSTIDQYPGTAQWGPIMGLDPFLLSSSTTQTRWSNGAYPDGSNPGQDDVALISKYLDPIVDTNVSPATAEPVDQASLVANTSRPSISEHTISTNTDRDTFSVDVTEGYLKTTLRSLYSAPNLNPTFRIINNLGNELAVSTPAIYGESALALDLPNGRYYVEVSGDAAQVGVPTHGSMGYYQLWMSTVDRPTQPQPVQLKPIRDHVMLASWLPGNSRFYGPVSYVYKVCDIGAPIGTQNCTAPITTSNLFGEVQVDRCSALYLLLVDAIDQRGVTSYVIQYGPAANYGWCTPTAPTVQRIRYNPNNNSVGVDLSPGQEFAPVTATSHTLTVTNTATSETFVKTFGVGQLAVTADLPPTWKNTTVSVTVQTNTNAAAPFNVSAISSAASVVIGRLDAPQADPPSSSAPRGDAPQAPGVTVPRGAAPQA